MSRRAKIVETIRTVCLGGQELSYVLRRTNRRRTIGLMVDHEGLKVASPWYVPMHEIYEMLLRSEAWVLDKLAAWQSRLPAERGWASGDVLHFLGKNVQLKLDVALVGHGVWLERGLMHVYAPSRDAQAVRELVTIWYRDQAARHFPERVAAVSPSLGVRASRVIVSNARTQWGCCNSEGEVRLNWRLMQARPAVIDYVVVHELAHLRHMDHSPAFWAAVAAACPQYRKLREELKEKDLTYRVL
jgi:predicted metal-dependent hydrolase